MTSRTVFLIVLRLLADWAITIVAQDGEGTCTAEDVNCSPSWWGVPQDLRDDVAKENFRQAETYMSTVVMVDPTYETVRDICKFENERCSYWAAIGECQANPEFMLPKCAPSCHSCDYLDWNLRCPFDKNQVLWKDTGKVYNLKERLVQNYNATVQSDDPWVLTVDDFLSEQDCQTLIDWGHKLEFERSVDAGKILEDGTMESVISDHRTSTNAWCLGDCYNDTVTQTVIERLETMLDIPRIHYEYFQLLKYEVSML